MACEFDFFLGGFIASPAFDTELGSNNWWVDRAHVDQLAGFHCRLAFRLVGFSFDQKVAMLVSVKVFPDASCDEVIERSRARFEIFVRAAPRDGAATQATIRLLAEHLGVPQGQVRLVRGARTRQKLFEIP